MRASTLGSVIPCIVVLLVMGLLSPVTSAAEWRAGVAKGKITPEQPIWMSGYASRDRPAEGTLHDLWAKALWLEDGEGNGAVLITADVCGIDRELSQRVCRRVQDANGLKRDAVAICVSHTHTGPAVGGNLRPMFFLDAKQQALVDQYTQALEDKLVDVAHEAMRASKPARVEWGIGKATFAVNRRANKEEDVTRLRAEGGLKGPVDHDLPVLVVRTPKTGEVSAVVFGYACHATTLSFYQWSGDWPGFAQIELEKQFPGAAALFVAGCGADQNPLPRRTVQLAEEYGRQAAAGVAEAMKASLRQVGGRLESRYAETSLPFAALPTRGQLDQDATSKDKYVAQRARLLRSQLDRDGKLSPTYPYPVQVWKLGDGPTVVLLGGEVVVDYSLRLKRELGAPRTWVAGYANDVMAYIPSKRVLDEGGYEGGGAMVYYGLPSSWAPDVEERIVREVRRLAGDSPREQPVP
jgi:hypothetical protein